MGGPESVRSWLERDVPASDDGRSTVYGVERSEFGDYDWRNEIDETEALGYADNPQDCVAVQHALGDVGAAIQRSSVSSLFSKFVRGRAHDHPDYSASVCRPQRVFQVENYTVIASLDDDVLYKQLMSGRVVTRLGAETGLGKTMKLPGAIATKCGLRVLQVELDDIVAGDAMEYQSQLYNVRSSARRWSRERGAYLTCMSYYEFRGIVCSGGRQRLFEDFDVIYLDEAQVSLGVVYAAKQYFAEYSLDKCSLIMASATASTEESNNVSARRVGKFTQANVTVDLDQAMNSGILMGMHLKDRTLFIVASDEQVARLRAYYIEQGVDVRVLDNASVKGDKAAAVAWLSNVSSVVPRVLVTAERFGTGYNLPVSYVITTGKVVVYELNAERALVEKEIPLMEKEIVQHKGRTGRQLAIGSGGWVMSAERAPDRELRASEALEAYISLIAADIRPKKELFAEVAGLLPRGIDRTVARLLLKFTLPIGLMVRYLGTDGRIAKRFVDAAELFLQQGEVLRPSQDYNPVGYDTWVEEIVGNYYEGDDNITEVKLKVPFKSPPGLKIAMHVLSAVAANLLEIPRWSPSVGEDLSDDETSGIRTKVKRVVPPREILDEVPKVVTQSTNSSVGWSYDVDPAGAAKERRRQAMSWQAQGDGKFAVTTLLKSIRDDELGKTKAVFTEDISQTEGRVEYSLPVDSESPIEIYSPGGAAIFSVVRPVHESFMSGASLTGEQFIKVLETLRKLKADKRFAKSTIFDNWSDAWISWFSTYSKEEVMEDVKRAALHRPALLILGWLYDRFSAEVMSVACSSTLYKDKLGGYFRKTPSLTKFASAVRKGRLPIAQSDRFVSRVLRIKDAHDEALMDVEKVGLFAPHRVTGAQKLLPLRDKNRRMPVIDEDVVVRPKVPNTYKEPRWRS